MISVSLPTGRNSTWRSVRGIYRVLSRTNGALMPVEPIHLIRHKDGRSWGKNEEQLNSTAKTVKFGLVSLEEEEGPDSKRTSFSMQGTAKPKLWLFFRFCFCLDLFINLIILELVLKTFLFSFIFIVQSLCLFTVFCHRLNKYCHNNKAYLPTLYCHRST